MTEEEAEIQLRFMILPGEDPTLTDPEVDSILQAARRPDADDLDYSDADWTPTWDLNAAAAEGWRRKAGYAASRFNFAEDSQRFDRAQIYAHCLAQAKQYADRSMGSIPNTT